MKVSGAIARPRPNCTSRFDSIVPWKSPPGFRTRQISARRRPTYRTWLYPLFGAAEPRVAKALTSAGFKQAHVVDFRQLLGSGEVRRGGGVDEQARVQPS